MRRVLSQASVIGRDFDIDVLAAVAGMDDEAVLDVVGRGLQAGLVTQVAGILDRYSFAHALTQHTLYDDLGSTRRARAHRRVADVLEQLYASSSEPRVAELAHHFLAATRSADATKAVTYCKMAGDQALAQAAPADAVGWFSHALELYPQLPGDESRLCDLLVGLGTAQRRTGDPAHRQTLLDAATVARSLGDGARLVAAALANSRGTATAGVVDEEKAAVLEVAIEAVGRRDSSDRARLLAILGSELMFGPDLDRSSSLCSEALAMARRLDDPLCFLNVTASVHSDNRPHTVAERLIDLTRAVTLAESLGDPRASFHANVERAVACLQIADRTGFDAHIDAAVSLADRMGEPFESWNATMFRSTRSLLSGDLDHARQEAAAALAIGADGVPEAMPTYGAQLIDLLRIQGHSDELAEMAELMAAAVPENPGLPVLRAALARTYCDLGRDDEAREVIENDLADGFAQFPYDMAWLPAMTALSEICVHLTHADGAACLYGSLSPWHALVSTAWCATIDGPVAFHLGALAVLLGRDHDAKGHFTEALDVSQRLTSPYWIARTQIARARVLLGDQGKAGDAATLLAEALSTARQYGFGVLREAAEALA
jgi:tetratricopeptide (TPR) repeat protein